MVHDPEKLDLPTELAMYAQVVCTAQGQHKHKWGGGVMPQVDGPLL